MNIVFVSTGNTCRGPMAEYFFREKAKAFGDYFNVMSYGTVCVGNHPANSLAVEVMKNRGIDISDHTAIQIDDEIIDAADFIFCFSKTNYTYITEKREDNVFLFGGGFGIEHPSSHSLSVYEYCAVRIEKQIEELLASDIFLNVQLMDPADIPQVAKIEKESFSMPWSVNSFFAHATRSYSRDFVAKYLGKTVGYICCEYLYDEITVCTFAVDESMRRRHIGDALLDIVCSIGWHVGAEKVTLEVRDSNEPAIRLYENQGFKLLGIRKNFYSRPVEDARIMSFNFVDEVLCPDEYTCY